jgi:predicted nucleic-acid-binding Zn-ribbon protein
MKHLLKCPDCGCEWYVEDEGIACPKCGYEML